MSILSINQMNVRFQTPDGLVQAVSDLSYSINKGETLGIVGESGSGKSQSVFALMGLTADNGLVSGEANFHGENLLSMSKSQLNHIRAEKIGMIFQDPMTSLNPFMKIGKQLAEVLMVHKGMSRREADKEAIAMLDAVRIPSAATRMAQYPHEMSGGMRQRVMIAMALLCKPELLIADEPTTALDVTVQAQILTLLRELQAEFNTAILLITHDMGVVAEMCDRILVMYGGRKMEEADTESIFATPSHPYTQGLLKAIPSISEDMDRLPTIPGNPPSALIHNKGCPFKERCNEYRPECSAQMPPFRALSTSQGLACHVNAPASITSIARSA
ncbi:ATP-binding cassette domain-containing protein [Vibrio europaeus]|uniref:ATP-binding cassette domain-containing protein n=1 Tax=Vibrio europaeus TaxID=300876 RepID=A0AAE7B2D3_9VIBR|nr:oligopeptide/dipeptide ABC transporter ATP-binding protein [Vibrio europaeus]MDC5805264.1 ATP-binding cassette domain-containing protein [Vibrio europaeus]MDC5811431.1 ATP-binding cassette domain-containing protein [Vibrio europaeus]MDC5826661.1 ATP-binding cassette domain-containing protein [Vibrio europaeus]MDC5832027.1 ATP-binding cassette domain-containing protein [Vibrio europaeus]MDC5834982.1 ATP-binding cassette domain-containing protein [Vibrio europaeus]